MVENICPVMPFVPTLFTTQTAIEGISAFDESGVGYTAPYDAMLTASAGDFPFAAASPTPDDFALLEPKGDMSAVEAWRQAPGGGKTGQLAKGFASDLEKLRLDLKAEEGLDAEGKITRYQNFLSAWMTEAVSHLTEDEIKALAIAIVDVGAIDDFHQREFPEFRPYPRSKPSMPEQRVQVDLIKLFENFPEGMRSAMIKARSFVLQLTIGCEQRCTFCAFLTGGVVKAEFTTESVVEFIKKYSEILRRDDGMSAIFYYASEPLEHFGYAAILENAFRSGMMVYTSTTAPKGHTAELLQVVDLHRRYDKNPGDKKDELPLRFSVTRQNFMRIAILEAAVTAIWKKPGMNPVALPGGVRAATQGRTVRADSPLSTDNISGISCDGGLHMTPEGIFNVLPTIITRTVRGRTGNLYIPLTPDSDIILQAMSTKHRDRLFGRKRKVYKKNPDGSWVSGEQEMFESAIANFLNYDREVTESVDAHRSLALGHGARENDDSTALKLLLEEARADDSVPVIPCFNRKAFKEYVGEAIPQEYVSRIVHLIVWGRYRWRILKKFREGQPEATTPDEAAKLKKYEDLPSEGMAVLKTLDALGLI